MTESQELHKEHCPLIHTAYEDYCLNPTVDLVHEVCDKCKYSELCAKMLSIFQRHNAQDSSH